MEDWEPTEEEKIKFNALANLLLGERRWPEVRELLERELARMHAGWRPIQESGAFLQIAFWDEEEFLAYTRSHDPSKCGSVMWILPSYSLAWLQMAIAISQEGDDQKAIGCIDNALTIGGCPTHS